MKGKITLILLLIVFSINVSASGLVKNITPIIYSFPENIQVIPGDRQITIKWDMNYKGKIAAFQVYRTSTGEKGWRRIAEVKEKSYVDKGLYNKVKYAYMVRATDDYFNFSEFSKIVSAIAFSKNNESNDFLLLKNHITPDDPQKLVMNIFMGNTGKENHEEEVNVTIYDSEKKVIKKNKIRKMRKENPIVFTWDLRDTNQRQVLEGQYSVVVRIKDWELSRKFYIIR
ncbi:MAG: hypothetical protein KKH98_04085 [Spirochaetes bacterium]|nr:hypothetical protein [Spirochaetota bacterium]